MRRPSLLLSAALASTALVASCAHVTVGDPDLKPVRVTRNASDVQGCEMISRLRASAGNQKAVQTELENLTRSRDGNTLLLPEGQATDGTAYRCASPPSDTGGR